MDDFVYGGSELFHSTVVAKLRSIFIVGTEQSRCFKFLGIHIDCTDDFIKLSVQAYTNSLMEMNLSDLPREITTSEHGTN